MGFCSNRRHCTLSASETFKELLHKHCLFPFQNTAKNYNSTLRKREITDIFKKKIKKGEKKGETWNCG